MKVAEERGDRYRKGSALRRTHLRKQLVWGGEPVRFTGTALDPLLWRETLQAIETFQGCLLANRATRLSGGIERGQGCNCPRCR
jgi:hypothetical protein